MTLQQYNPQATGSDSLIVAYACEDISKVDILDAKGESVVSNSRLDRYPVEIGFVLSEEGGKRLIVSSDEEWSGEDFCAK